MSTYRPTVETDAEARALVAKHGPSDPAAMMTTDQMWSVLTEATPTTRDYLLGRCGHYWAWVSPAGTNKSARICMLCHEPDPVWLNHVVEVDRGHGAGCVNCEFAEVS